MARPFDEDSGVLASRELSPPFSSYDQPADRSPFWAPTSRSVTAPHATQPAAWSPYGTWSSNGKTIPPGYPTVGMGIKPRPRWMLRFFLFFVLVGAGAVLLRKQLPPFPRSIGEAARLWDQGKAWVKGKTGSSSVSSTAAAEKPVQTAAAVPATAAASAPKPVTPPVATATRARGPEIVPMPALPSAPVARAMPARVGRAHRDPLAAVPSRPRRRGLLARVRTTSARGGGASALAAMPSALASVPFKKAARPAADPFEDGAAPARAAAPPPPPRPAVEESKPEPVAAAEEPPAPRPAPRPRAAEPAPRAAAPDSLDALMATAVGHPVKRSTKGELDRKLASADEEAPPPPRKKAEPPPAHALTRGEIQSVMAGVQAKVGECYRKFQVPGAADVKIAVGEDGSVNTVQLTGPVAGTPSGACVERAVENAAFPASSGLRFDYRLQLR